MNCIHAQLDGRKVTCSHPEQPFGPHPHIGTCRSGCPYKQAAGASDELKSVVVRRQPTPSIRKMVKAAKTIITSRKVNREVRRARLAACRACDLLRYDDRKQSHWCGVCGCNISNDEKKVVNLILYEESSDAPLCQHPDRKEGKGWPTT